MTDSIGIFFRSLLVPRYVHSIKDPERTVLLADICYTLSLHLTNWRFRLGPRLAIPAVSTSGGSPTLALHVFPGFPGVLQCLTS